MALRRFFDRFARADAAAPSVAAVPGPSLQAPPEAIYPPRDPGLPTCDPEALVVAAADKLARLRELTISDRESFDVAYLAPVRELAHLVHLLPASPDGPYSAPAGLFHLCVDVAFFSLQSADGKIFTPTASVEDRHRNEPRWRYACFLAGLCCQVPRALNALTAVSSGGAEWPRYTQSLWSWLRESGADRYFVNWHAKTALMGGEGSAFLSLLAPKDRLDWLAKGDVQIVRDMHQVALGAAHEADSILAGVVGRIVKRVLEVDEARRRSRYGRLTVGTHVEPYILDALRAPIETGTWKVNSPSSPVWLASDGLFIEWPGAHQQVLAHFDKLGLPGMPRSSVTLAEVLGKADLLIQAESGLWVRDVLVPLDAQGRERRRSTAMRFVDPVAILGHLGADPLHGPVGAELVEAESRAASVAAAAAPAARAQRADVVDPVAQPAAAPEAAASPPRPAPLNGLEATGQLGSGQDAPGGLPVDDAGEIVFASLIKPEARRWISAPDLCEALGHLIHLHGKRRGEAAKSVSFGVALSTDWISENTVADIARLVSVLDRNRWLGRPPQVKNESLKLHDVQFDDAVKKAIVISPHGAAAIGFEFGAKRQ